MWLSHHVKSATEQRVERSFVCSDCGLHGTKSAVGKGEGEGMSVFFIGYGGMAQRSEAQADRNARRDAENLLAVVPCPACATRSVAGKRLLFRAFALRCVLPIAAAGAVIGFSVVARVEVIEWLIVPIGVATLLYAVIGAAGHVTQWTQARAKVAITVACPECGSDLTTPMTDASCSQCRALVHPGDCARAHEQKHRPPYR